MDKQLIGKYVAIGLIILAFAGIILGISRIFASKCSSGYSFYKDQNKCIKDCQSGYHYSNPAKNDWTCIPICDSGQDYFPAAKKCSACDPNSPGDDAGNPLVRHPNCKGGGVASCGADCSKRTLIDPTGQDKKKKDPRTAQVFDCGAGRCVCNPEYNYKLCPFHSSGPYNGVCYDPTKAICSCPPDSTGKCTVKPCAKICSSADGTTRFCCKDKNETCCKSGQCCPKGSKCDSNTGECCDDKSVSISDGGCCSPDRIYCSDDTLPKITKDQKGNKTASCSGGSKLKCCDDNLCITKGSSGTELTCCQSNEGARGCGKASKCGIAGALQNKCIQYIQGDSDNGLNCTDSKYTSPKNSICACVNPADYSQSTFQVPTNGTCPIASEKPASVVVWYYPGDKEAAKCTGDGECPGYSNVNDSCYEFKDGTGWDLDNPKSGTDCSVSGAHIAYAGECLMGCNQDEKRPIYCPKSSACETDKNTNKTYCKPNQSKWGQEQTWPGNDIDEHPLWAQVYTPAKKQNYCPVGAITCEYGGAKCPKYQPLTGSAAAQQQKHDKEYPLLTCVDENGIEVTSSSPKGTCQAPLEVDLSGKKFCRVNYFNSPPTNGPYDVYPSPDSTDFDYNRAVLSRLSFLGDNRTQACKLEGVEGSCLPCEANMFTTEKDNAGKRVTQCGDLYSIASQSFPFYTNSSTLYKGPVRDIETFDEGPLQVWGCSGQPGLQQGSPPSTWANCPNPSTSGAKAVYYGALSKDFGVNTAMMNALGGNKDKTWSTYRTTTWPSADGGDVNSCYARALSRGDETQKLIRVTWDEKAKLCKAEYAPSQDCIVDAAGNSNCPCDGQAQDTPDGKCISTMKLSEDTPSHVDSGLTCMIPCGTNRCDSSMPDSARNSPGFLGLNNNPNDSPESNANGVFTCGHLDTSLTPGLPASRSDD